jgi:PPOX class probable F420-dependent enzyme
MQIPESAPDLVAFEKPAFAVLATVMPDGRPQATPVWFDVQDEYFRANTTRGRIKDFNMSVRGAVALAILDPDNPYRYLHVQGEVICQTVEGARAHLDHLALKYHGVERYPNPTEGQTRVICTIEPESFFTNK